MAWVAKDLKDHPLSMPLPGAGMPPTKSGCPQLHPTWSSALPGMGHPQLLWQSVPVSSHPHSKEFLPNNLI